MKRLKPISAFAAAIVTLPLFFFACSSEEDPGWDPIGVKPPSSSPISTVSSDSGPIQAVSSSSVGDPNSVSSGDSSVSGGDSSVSGGNSSVSGGESSVSGGNSSAGGQIVSSAAEEPSSSSEEVIIPKPTIICEFSSNTYVVGQEVSRPYTYCDDGTDLDNIAYNPGTWLAAVNSSKWITGDKTTFSTTGKSLYGVGGTCGGVVAEGSCTQLEITATPNATCNFGDLPSYEAGDIFNPGAASIGCSGNAVASGGEVKHKSGPALDASGAFDTAGESVWQVTGVTCGGVDVANNDCIPKIEVTAPIITCSWSSSVVGGKDVSAPAIACKNGKTPAGGNFTLNGTAVTFPHTTAFAANNTTVNYEVSGVTCGGYAAAKATCALSVTKSPNATCSFAKSAYILNETVTAPTVGCSSGTKGGTEGFTNNRALVDASWKAIAEGTSAYEVDGVTCDGIPVPKVSCGSISVGPVPTATCTWSTKTYNIGVNVGAPTINCSAGSVDKSGASFDPGATVAAKAAANWLATPTATTTYYESAGTSNYTLKGIKCGTYTVADVTCDELTISPVTCAVSGGPYDIGESFNATVAKCEGTTTVATSLPTAGAGQSVTLASLSCGNTGSKVTVTNTTCTGTVEINKEPTCDAYVGINGKSWADICGTVKWKDVKWNTVPSRSGQLINSGAETCYWVKDWTWSGNNGVGFNGFNGWKVNGYSVDGNPNPNNDANFKSGVTNKVDGGIYIYIPKHTGGVNSTDVSGITAGSSKPYCAGGPAPALTCGNLNDVNAMVGKTYKVPLTCSDDSQPIFKGWSSGGPQLTPATANTYSGLTAIARCGSGDDTDRTASCSGTLTVQEESVCAGYTNLSTVCGNVDWLDIKYELPVSNSNVNNGKINGGKAACYWIQEWTGTNQKGFDQIKDWKVNGHVFSDKKNASDLTAAFADAKGDGGIYIYIPDHSTVSNRVEIASANTMVKGNKPYCAGGPAPTLSCGNVNDVSALEGGSFTISSSTLPLTCSDKSTPSAPFAYVSSSPTLNTAGMVKGDYTSLTVSAVCGTTKKTPVINATCGGTLKVVDANAACYAQQSDNLSKTSVGGLCPGATWNDVLWNVAPSSTVQFPGVNNGRIPAGCFWVEGWNTNFTNNFGSNNSVKFRVNGVEFTGESQQPNNNVNLRNALNDKVKGDGGIYIWIEADGAATVTSGGVTYKAYSKATSNFANGALIAGSSPPFCKDQIHAVTCPSIAGEKEAGSSMSAPVPVCRSGDTPNIASWVNEPTWSGLVEGSYTVGVNATCGTSGTLSASCGTLTVVPAGSVVTKAVCNADVEFTTGTYNVTIASNCIGGSVGTSFMCQAKVNSNLNAVTYNGGSRKSGGALENGAGNSGWWENAGPAVTGPSSLVVEGNVFCKVRN